MTIQDVRESTHIDLVNNLDKHGKCAFVRPTGFGKTWELTRLAHDYSNVLYLYPAEVIRNTVVARYAELEEFDEETELTVAEFEKLSGVTLMSYMKLIRLSDDEIKTMSYDLIIMDEVHRVGGEMTRQAIEKLFAYCTEAKFVGATATPNRSDGIDVVDMFFDDICVYPYTLHDAFQDGLLKRPYYCFCTYNILEQVSKDMKREALTAGEDINNLRVKEVLDARIIEIANMYEMDKVIQDTCNKYASDTSYMKFIVFFDGIDHVRDKQSDVVHWFKHAYPDHCVNDPLVIVCDDEGNGRNVNKLNDMRRRENTIDLVFCVNMLNMGYHVNDITGIIMYRGTASDIVYIQQLGRALSSGSDNACIVFDVVDNLHRKAMYDTVDRADLDDHSNEVSDDNAVKGSSRDIGVQSTDSLLDQDTIVVSDDFNTNDEVNSTKWWRSCNRLLREDLHAVGNQATYKELIAKAVAEPMVQRCLEAFEAHFHRWCKNNGVPYPISNSELESLYNLSKDDFIKYFKETIEENGIDYPMGDATKLLQIGRNKNKDDGIPLEIFAKWKNVSVSAVLDALGVA